MSLLPEISHRIVQHGESTQGMQCTNLLGEVEDDFVAVAVTAILVQIDADMGCKRRRQFLSIVERYQAIILRVIEMYRCLLYTSPSPRD